MTGKGLCDASQEAPEGTLIPCVLSERERQVLSLTASGKTAAQVGQVLYLSERTVNFHVANAVAKLAAANKTEAVAIAVRSGWI